MSTETKDTAQRLAGLELFKRRVTVQRQFLPVIDGGAADAALAKREAGSANDVQRGPRRHAQADDVAGIRRDFRFQ